MMKRLISTLGLAMLLAPLAPAQTSTWKPDLAHSGVDFAVLHLSVAKVRGHFNLKDGEVLWNEADITKSKVNVVIDVTSVNTGVDKRDSDIKTDAMFDAAKFPTATFTSTSISKKAGGLSIKGDLTLHGVTKPVTLDVEGPTGPVDGMDKKKHSGFAATTTIDRTAFGMGAKYPDAVIGNQIKLTIDLDLAKQ